MNTTGLRVVIDTNVLIAMIGRISPYRWMFDQIIEGGLTLCVTTEILLEYEEVLARKTSTEVTENLMQFLSVHPFVERVEPFYRFRVIDNDPDDDKFVDCAVAGSADYLISNDRHFQHLQSDEFPKISVLTAEEFTQRMF